MDGWVDRWVDGWMDGVYTRMNDPPFSLTQIEMTQIQSGVKNHPELLLRL